MKLLLVCLLVSALVVVALSETPVKCTQPCDQSQCPPVDESECKCGVKQDSCGCCTFCARCEGDDCVTTVSGQCPEPMVCVPKNPQLSRYAPGTCQNKS